MTQVCPDLSLADIFYQLARSRYSCRAFEDRAVPQKTIRDIIKTASQAASWCNVQPWHLHIVSGEKLDLLRREMSARPHDEPSDIAFPPPYEGDYKLRRQAAGWALYKALGIARDDCQARSAQGERNFQCFDAPHLAILSTDARIGPYSLLDCGGFLAHFQLAARSHGVDTIAQAAIAHHCQLLHGAFGIPQDLAILCGISFGYGIKDHPVNSYRTQRADCDEFTHWL